MEANKKNDGQLEQEPLTYDEAAALLKEKHEFPEGTEAFIGPKNMQRIQSLAYDQHLTDVEALFLCGQMTTEEFEQYIIQVDEIRRLRGSIFKIASEIASYVIENHREALGLEPDVKQEEPVPTQTQTETRKSLGSFFKNLLNPSAKQKQPQAPQPAQNEESTLHEPLIAVFQNIEDVVYSQGISKKCFRGRILVSLVDAIFSIITSIMTQELNCKHKRHKFSDKRRKQLEQTLKELTDKWGELFDHPFSGVFARTQRNNAMNIIYFNDLHRERFFSFIFGTKDLASLPSKQSKKWTESMERETEELFGVINDLSCLRKITPETRKFGEMEIKIFEDYEEIPRKTFNRALKICRAQIVLDPSIPIKPYEPVVNPDGSISVKMGENQHLVEVEIDRGTGEIVLSGTHLPLSTLMREDACLLLKKYLFEFVLDHLERKEDEITDLFKAPEKEGEKEETPMRIAGKQRKQVCKQLGTRTLEPENVDQKEPTTETPDDDFEHVKLRGLPGNRVLRAAEAKLGKPLRVSGSHHVFKSRNEGTCVIAIHGSDQVGIGMLKTFLDRAGIPPREFSDAL